LKEKNITQKNQEALYQLLFIEQFNRWMCIGTLFSRVANISLVWRRSNQLNSHILKLKTRIWIKLCR